MAPRQCKQNVDSFRFIYGGFLMHVWAAAAAQPNHGVPADVHYATWVTSGVLINMFGQGLVLSYTTSLLPALQRPESTIRSDLNTSSWLGGLLGISGVIGFVISSFLMKLLGRKIAHILAILPAIVGWLIIYFTTNMPMLMAGRFLGGLSSTATVSLGAVVIGEYTSPQYRGVFLYLKNASVCMGALVMHILAHYLHWRTIALISMTPLIIALVIVCTWPESPAWLASKQQYRSSTAAFHWLRGYKECAKKELEEIIKAQKYMCSKLKPLKAKSLKPERNIFRKYIQKDLWMPCLVVVLATAVLELSGRHVFPSYASQIVAEITGNTSQSFYSTLALDITITISSILASVLVKRMKRRALLFSTGFASVFVLLSTCVYNIMTNKNIIPNEKTWTPIILLIIYCSLANLGCAPIPLALVGEVFPLAHREVGVTVSGIWISICLLGGLYSTPHLIANLGVYGYFAVYGSMMGIALIILYFIMPETKDKTLQEIENYFNHGKFRSDVDDTDIEHEENIIMM